MLCEHNRELVRWIRVAHNIGSDMVYWLMPVSSIPIANLTVQHVTTKDMRDTDITQQIQQFTQCLKEQLNETNFLIEDQHYPLDLYIDYDADVDLKPLESDRPEAEEVDDYNKYIRATFVLDPIHNSDNVGTRAKVIAAG